MVSEKETLIQKFYRLNHSITRQSWRQNGIASNLFIVDLQNIIYGKKTQVSKPSFNKYLTIYLSMVV